MEHKDILKQHMGQPIHEPGMNVECVAWPKLYCAERGYSIGWFSGSAIKGWETGSPFNKGWKRVKYTGLNAPAEGDILFWDERRCKNGHTAVANKFCTPFLLRYSDVNGTGKQDVLQNRFSTTRFLVGWFHKI